jgi:hypothetical protein
MSEPRVKSRRLSCTAVDSVEVDFPQPITPRLVLQFSEGISILAATPLRTSGQDFLSMLADVVNGWQFGHSYLKTFTFVSMQGRRS